MSLARRLLLRASRSAWLADQLRRRAFFRRAARRFLPGEDLAAALDAAAHFARAGLGTLLTQLGEQVRNPAEARAVRDHYLDVLCQVRRRGLPVQVSVKLTHLGLDVDRAACAAALGALAARAEQTGSFLWIDMEESRYVDATLDLYRAVRSEHARGGVCRRAYLHRTFTDLDRLLPLGPAIRVVKGAYNEPPAVAFPKKRDVDAAYVALAERLLKEAARARALGVPRDGYEVHMLYGIRSADQRALAADGCVVRVLVSYGTHWFPWYVRRLAERPANVWFVLRNLV